MRSDPITGCRRCCCCLGVIWGVIRGVWTHKIAISQYWVLGSVLLPTDRVKMHKLSNQSLHRFGTFSSLHLPRTRTYHRLPIQCIHHVSTSASSKHHSQVILGSCEIVVRTITQ